MAKTPTKRNMQDAYITLHQSLKKQVVALTKRVEELERLAKAKT